MQKSKNIRAAMVALTCILACQTAALAQPHPADPPFKEVRVAANAFSLGDPVPSWVDTAAVPEVTGRPPVVIRLADTQFMVGKTPVVFARRSLTINDPGSLSAAGQIPLSFAPDYQRLQLHSISVIRGGEAQDRTGSVTIRFLQRELGLEQGIYSGSITVSILVSDLRVGDTLEYSFSLIGQNPVLGNKFVDWTS
jgi:hypothetical protein